MTDSGKRGIAGLLIAAVVIAVVVLLGVARLAPDALAISQWIALLGILAGVSAIAAWILRTYKD